MIDPKKKEVIVVLMKRDESLDEEVKLLLAGFKSLTTL